MQCPRCYGNIPDGSTISPCCGRPVATNPPTGGIVQFYSEIASIDLDEREERIVQTIMDIDARVDRLTQEQVDLLALAVSDIRSEAEKDTTATVRRFHRLRTEIKARFLAHGRWIAGAYALGAVDLGLTLWRLI